MALPTICARMSILVGAYNAFPLSLHQIKVDRDEKVFVCVFSMLRGALCLCRRQFEPRQESGRQLFFNVYADTCTVDISTVLLDSIETRGIVFVSLAITRIRYGEKYSRLIMPSIRKLVLHLMRIMPIALIHWC